MFLESFQFPVCHDPHLSYVCHLSERLSEVRTALSRSQCFSSMMAGPRVWSVILLSSVLCLCRAYEVVNSTEIKAETNSGLKNYEEEEDGKVLPYRYSGHVETHKLTCMWFQNISDHSGDRGDLCGDGGVGDPPLPAHHLRLYVRLGPAQVLQVAAEWQWQSKLQIA